jgi:hypothetical protein
VDGILLEGPPIDVDKVWPQDYFKAKQSKNYTDKTTVMNDRNTSSNQTNLAKDPMSQIKIKHLTNAKT